ncbi:putative acetyltransferase [Corynebacterium capitovis DSM 44611]|uniref:N-acetylglutamate synthase, CG3035 family n=1 Tax=Corynebacterium capitovis TaxID=131081 RepID=UPI00036FF8F8|nr:GNAT family N-acetyltransferase [Corynebacterium capitovis]WKD58205.1 putative acetyltransferase [Corynebacterium capitovis DSM 44611]
MPGFFRSEEIRPGDRVVARRVRGEQASDIIGHVVSVDPLVLRPQKVGGLPSSKDAIEVGDVHVLKKLSPRTVRNSDIRAIETATAKAFPGHEQQLIDGWLARSGADIAERSNSAVPIGHSAGFTPVPLDALKRFYAERGQPVQLLIPERIGKPALTVLDEHWTVGEDILVMTHPLTDLADPSPRFRIDDAPDDAWLSMYHYRGLDLPAEAVLALAKSIDGRIAFARLVEDDRTAAITRATLTTSHDGRLWLGYSAVEVHPDYRRRGLGTELTRSLLAWGKAEGAAGAYLQTLASNDAAIGMYTKIGFTEHHRHRYARLG